MSRFRSRRGSSSDGVRVKPRSLRRSGFVVSFGSFGIESRFDGLAQRFRLGDPNLAMRGRAARGDECLYLEQDGAGALERTRDCGAGFAVDGSSEYLRRVGHADKADARHLEDADLVGRAEAVLDGAQNAVRAITVALELQHAV